MLSLEEEQKINTLLLTGTEENIALALEISRGFGVPEPPLYKTLEGALSEISDGWDGSFDDIPEMLAFIRDKGVYICPQLIEFNTKTGAFVERHWLGLAPYVEHFYISAGDQEYNDDRFPSLNALAKELSVFNRLKSIYIEFSAFEYDAYPAVWDLSLVKSFTYDWSHKRFPIYAYAPYLERLTIREIETIHAGDLSELLKKFPHLKHLSLEFVGESEMSMWWAGGGRRNKYLMNGDIILSELRDFPNITSLEVQAKTSDPRKHPFEVSVLKELTHLTHLNTKGVVLI
jgi:hypothetical protein